MRLGIKDFCIRCGLCEDLCPELFTLDYEKDEAVIKVDEVPEELEEAAKDVIRDCAVTAIYIKEA